MIAEQGDIWSHDSPSGNRAGPEPGGRRAARISRRACRLRTRSQLDYVKANGRSRAGRLCVVKAAPPPDEQRRLAIVVSRRYSPKAVERNRARRLLREAYRLVLPELRPAWIVLIPRRYLLGAGLGDVLAEVRRLLERLRLLAEAVPNDR